MPISEKQKKILAFPFTHYDALICDGSIRSGKTSIMMVSFIDWGMREFDGQSFGIAGKTVDSTKKNLIVPYTNMTYWNDKYSVKWHGQYKILEVNDGRHENYFEVFGGRDESSFTLIQGRTLAGILLDEVTLQPRSFVEQALARCSVEGSKLWFNCNPGSPQHWFYKEWVQHAEEQNAIRLHFNLDDNPSLPPAIVERYKKMYSGVFYKRYILGEWVMAEGLVYDFREEHITDEIPQGGDYYISIDYGTQNPFSAGLWNLLGSKAVRIREYYYSGRDTGKQRTDEEYCDDVKQLAAGLHIRRVIVDPSASSFIAALRKKGWNVIKANNEVLDGIRRVSQCLESGKIKIHRSCKDAIREFGLYSWNPKSEEDKVIQENDHAMDDIRYFVNTIMKHRIYEG